MTTIKPLTLTKEQGNKLDEMLDLLDGWICAGGPDENGLITFYTGDDMASITIHWYELCMTSLCRAIGNADRTNKSEYYDETDMRSDMVREQEWIKTYHPVDFLYNQSKKIK